MDVAHRFTAQRNVGTHEGVTPFIVTAFDSERRPLMLLPLALTTVNGAYNFQVLQ